MDVGEKTSKAEERHTGQPCLQCLVPQHGEAHIGCAGREARKGNHFRVGNYAKPGGLWTSWQHRPGDKGQR